MVSMLLIAIIGWPGIITSLGLSLAGVARRRHGWLLAGALVGLPFAWYLSALPLFKGAGLFLPLFQLGAAYAIYRGHRPLALLCLLPLISITIWLAFVVLSQ
jgi:hypothetical protein